MTPCEHKKQAAPIRGRCAIITLSDTRTEADDRSGRKIRDMLAANHDEADYRLIPDDPARLKTALEELLARPDIDAILTNGGTGIARRDNTIAVVDQTIEKPLPGFGELFRMLSYQQVNSSAMLSRATAGIAKGKLIFAMPGSTNAVELAMEKLILPELGHLVWELRK